METMALQLFNLFPEPAFFIDQQQACHYNRAAAELLPQFAASQRLPEKISNIISAYGEETNGKVHIRNEEFFISAQESEKGCFIFLHKLDKQLKLSDQCRITSKMRDQITGLAAVIQRLTAEPAALDREKYEQYLAVADQGIYRMLRMIDHLEIMEHPDHTMFHPAPMDMAGLYACVGRQLEDICREVGRSFSYELEMDSLLTIGDSALLERMLLCLISNAMEASKPDKSFGFRLSKRGNRAILTVWDNGLGAGKMDRVFVAGQTDLPELQSGLGLGLPIVRRIADLHGGTIMLEGGSENGMRVVVSLPVRENTWLPLHAPQGKRWDSRSGFLPVMVELSEVLPASLYRAEDDL